jgi:hypothetical protein
MYTWERNVWYDTDGDLLAFRRKEGWFDCLCELCGTEYAGVGQEASERRQPRGLTSSCPSRNIYVAVVLTPVVKTNSQRNVS